MQTYNKYNMKTMLTKAIVYKYKTKCNKIYLRS